MAFKRHSKCTEKVALPVDEREIDREGVVLGVSERERLDDFDAERETV